MFEQRANAGHSVDNNNNIRSKAAGDLTRAWKLHDPAQKHLMAVFATVEANALCWYNYKYRYTLTKVQWRTLLIPDLLSAMKRTHHDVPDQKSSA